MLPDFAQLLLELYGAARVLSVAEFPEFAFSLIGTALRFDAARYTTLKFLHPGALVYTTHLRNDGVDTAFDWQQINRHDNVIPALEAAPGRALNFHRPDDRYAEHDQWVLESLMPHIVEALRINEALGVRAAQDEARARACLAIAGRDGAIHFAGPGFVELMRRELPQWQSAHLPSCVLDGLRRVGGGGYMGRSVELSAQHSGDFLFVSARKPNPHACLSLREQRVAALYGVGRSYKAIARELQLSPATVRNHLQRIYAKLGVNDKAQLAILMAHQGNVEAGGERRRAAG